MNKILSVALFSLFALSLACSSPKPKTFTISGQIKNPPAGNLVLSQEVDLNRKISRVIGVIPVDSDGNFAAEFDLEPHLYTLNFYEKKSVQLAVDRGQKILIAADGGGLTDIRVEGSADTDLLGKYEDFRVESLDRLVKSVRAEIKQLADKPGQETEIEKLNELEIANYDKHRDELIDFIKNKMGTSIAVYATSLRWGGDENVPFLEELAIDFEKKHPGLAVTEKIREKVDILKNTSVGGKAPDMDLPDKANRKIRLSTLRGKYILIDFWASWCSPCRRESLTIAGLYDKYKDQGFEIYGVSLDEESDAWIGAVENDKRIWPNVSTLEGFSTPATFEYGVTALPAKFLIDAEGKIIAKNLHGNQLKDLIEKLFAK